MNTDNSLSRVLHEITEVPGPEGLADKALRRARTRRAKGFAAGAAGAFAAAAVIAAPFLLTDKGGEGQFAAPPSTPSLMAPVNANNNAAPCEWATTRPGVKKVPKENWPDYVQATIDRLPARSDYALQSGTVGMCNNEAYAVINLGENREAGHITVRLNAQPAQNVPADCDKAKTAQSNREAPQSPHEFKVLFCEEGGKFKMVYGIDDGNNNYRVYAIYPDGRMVAMEAMGVDPDSVPAITAEQLRAVVTDVDMLAYFP